MPLLAQDYLRSGKSLDELTAQYAIKVSRGLERPNLVLLKYNQSESPMSEAIVRQCRGIVLDEADNWNLVSRSFDKFFNHGEALAAKIDWSSAVVQEKLDGSLCVLYFYDGAWRVQTSGHPEAAGAAHDSGYTFAQLFWEIFKAEGYTLPPAGRYSLAFELTSSHNRIIVRHAEPHLTLLGVRDLASGAELPLSSMARHGFRTVRAFPLGSVEEIIASLDTIDPLKQEGYVVMDGQFRRVKVKHPAYVAMHHLLERHSTRRLLEVVQHGEQAEMLAYFPEWRAEVERIESGLRGIEAELVEAYRKIEGIASQKEFALEALKTRCSAALFAVRAKKSASFHEFLLRQTPEMLMKLLGLKNVESAELDQ